MDDKKKAIMEAAVTLFANKGYNTTSVQEIADKCEMSKGAFYLHFRSKEELMLSIFQYYSALVIQKMAKVEQMDLSPKEKLIGQVEVHLQEVIARRELLILQFREQMIYMNKDIEEFFRKLNNKKNNWHETRFLALYGESIRPYLLDLSRLFDGMLNSYLKLMIRQSVQLDMNQLAAFIVNRLDDIVTGILTNNEKPILTRELFTSSANRWDSLKEIVGQLLEAMKAEIQTLDAEPDNKNELIDLLNILSDEIRKNEPKAIVFRGILGNFNVFEKLQPYTEEIMKHTESLK